MLQKVQTYWICSCTRIADSGWANGDGDGSTWSIAIKTANNYEYDALYAMHVELHKYIIKKEFFRFLTLEPRCNGHHLPCGRAEQRILFIIQGF